MTNAIHVQGASPTVARMIYNRASSAANWGARHVVQITTAVGLAAAAAAAYLKVNFVAVLAFCQMNALPLSLGLGIPGAVIAISLLAIYIFRKIKQQKSPLPAQQQSVPIAPPMAPLNNNNVIANNNNQNGRPRQQPPRVARQPRQPSAPAEEVVPQRVTRSSKAAPEQPPVVEKDVTKKAPSTKKAVQFETKEKAIDKSPAEEPRRATRSTPASQEALAARTMRSQENKKQPSMEKHETPKKKQEEKQPALETPSTRMATRNSSIVPKAPASKEKPVSQPAPAARPVVAPAPKAPASKEKPVSQPAPAARPVAASVPKAPASKEKPVSQPAPAARPVVASAPKTPASKEKPAPQPVPAARPVVASAVSPMPAAKPPRAKITVPTATPVTAPASTTQTTESATGWFTGITERLKEVPGASLAAWAWGGFKSVDNK